MHFCQKPASCLLTYRGITRGRKSPDHGPPDFWLPPCFPPSFVLNFTFKFVWLTYTADNFQPAKFETIWRHSGEGSDDIHKPMLDLIGLITANKSSLQWKITMQERHLCWPPYFFPWPRSGRPQFFHSRIATGAKWLRRAPESTDNVTSTFFSRVHLLPKDLRFEHGSAKLASCPGPHLTSLRPC